MATSGTTTFSQTLNEAITDALLMINAISIGEIPTDDDMQIASRELNRMIKYWEAQGIHLWTMGTAILFPQKYQKSYKLSTTSTDHAASLTESDQNYSQTTLSADNIATDTTLTVASSSGFATSDKIGIVLDDNTLYWTTVSSVPTSTSIIITAGLSGAASSGNFVFGYTTQLAQPAKISSVNRIQINANQSSNIDTPLDMLSYEDYFELPNKDQYGTPISCNYIKDRDYGTLIFWLVPENINYIFRFTYTRKIQDMLTSNIDFDFPQEWLDTIVTNLAARLCKYFGKNSGDFYTSLKQEAQESLDNILSYDTEEGSIFIRPSYRGR